MDTISSFQGNNRFLSNFFPSPIILDDVSYQTVEHWYQAAKAARPEDRVEITNAPSPSKAKRLGSRVLLVDNWDSVKVSIMRRGVWAKFTQNADLEKKLLCTANAFLIEGNTWNDRFWGQSPVGHGLNVLGSMLMEARGMLRYRAANTTTS